MHARRVRAAVPIELSLWFPDAQLDALAGAVLGPTDEPPTAYVLRPAWGQVVPVRLPIGERVTLHAADEQGAVDVRYLHDDEGGPLPSRTWRLEPEEAPVLLLALLGTQAGTTLGEALEQATAIAGVLLLEAASTGEDPA